MVRVAGVDPGTGSFDLCVLEDGKPMGWKTLPTARVLEKPEILVESLKAFSPLDLVVGPSGHGLPLKPLAELSEDEVRLLALVKAEDSSTITGLRRVLAALKASQLPVVVIPGVKHLPTVPTHRKVNRIDLGTADKLCSAALAIYDQAKALGLGFHEASFILVELGLGFTAALAVAEGRIVDGLGGTSGAMGFLSPGALDGELAYLIGKIGKENLVGGGVLQVSGMTGKRVEEFFEALKRENERCRLAFKAYIERIVGAVASLVATTGKPREILFSGRLSRFKPVLDELSSRLSAFAPVRLVKGLGLPVKEAAQGAALLADGLAGGENKPLVEVLRVREASGSVLDHIYIEGLNLKSMFSQD